MRKEREQKENMVSSVGVCRRLLLITVLLGFVCIGVSSVQSQTAAAATTTVTVESRKHESGREKLVVYESEMDFKYMMSKRKVPNGPDPIHNRRAGNSKRPPGKD